MCVMSSHIFEERTHMVIYAMRVILMLYMLKIGVLGILHLDICSYLHGNFVM